MHFPSQQGTFELEGDTTASASGTFSAVVHLQPQPAVYSLARGGYGGGVRVLTEAWTSSR